jgi:hypothetical protein
MKFRHKSPQVPPSPPGGTLDVKSPRGDLVGLVSEKNGFNGLFGMKTVCKEMETSTWVGRLHYKGCASSTLHFFKKIFDSRERNISFRLIWQPLGRFSTKKTITDKFIFKKFERSLPDNIRSNKRMSMMVRWKRKIVVEFERVLGEQVPPGGLD